MTDRAYESADANPFDQFDPDKVGASPANQNNKKPDDSFEEFNPFPGQGIKPQADQSSAVGAFARGAERSAIPAIGSLPAIGAGAEIGAGLGALTGPFAPIGVPVGGLIGGVIGGFTGGYALSQAQNYVLSKAPDSWKEKIGLDDRQEKLDEAEHPYASFLGGLTPYALTMRPGAVPTTKLPENATALQRILAHPATARVFGGAAMGGMELGQEAAGGQSPDWTKVAVSTGFGLVFNTPTRIGESLTELGARPTRTLLGQPQPVPAATAPPASEQPTEAPQEAPTPAPARPAPAEGIAPTLFHAPTVAQANDLGVMGPGATEQTFLGAHERNPDAAMTAQEAARTEQSMTQTAPSLPDIHEVARRMDPDLFDQYEELQWRKNTIQGWVETEGAENNPIAVGHLAAVNGELAELEPRVAAAYRRAAEASGHPTVEPQPVSESWGLFPPPEVRQPAPIDATHTVVSGANSSADAGGPIYVDPDIPAVSPTLKTANGEPAPLRKYVAIHEDAERNEMLRFAAEFKAQTGRTLTKNDPEWKTHYDNVAHPKIATPAERAAVEADGVNWTAYTHEIDGYLSHIEHKPNDNPPPNTITDPQADIGHHRSENKPVAETGIIGTAPRSIETQKQFIAADVAKQLAAAGRPQEEAEAAGKLVAARYEARAARMGGRLGTAQEFYEREGAQIRGPRGPAAPPPVAPPTVAPTPAAEVAPLAERAPAEQWDAFLAARQERDQRVRIATGFNDFRTRSGAAPLRARSSQQWVPGNVVDVGFVKDLLITAKNPDGTYTLIAKPDANGISKSYNAEPQKGLAGDRPVSFKEATAPLYEPETIHVGPKAARGPRAVPQERWSLLQFLTDKGGIRPDDKNIGDVRQSFGGKNHFEPGFGQLIRPGGMTLDRAREAAVEAGYIQDLGQTGVKSGEATSNLDTLLQAIDKESRGTRVYRQGIQPADARVREIDEAEAERDRAEQEETDKQVTDYLKDVGMKSSDIEPNIMARMRELIARQRLEPDIAHERAVMEADDHAVETENAPERAEHIPGWDLPDDAGAAQAAREGTPQGEAALGQSARTDREGDREKAWTEFYQRKQGTVEEFKAAMAALRAKRDVFQSEIEAAIKDKGRFVMDTNYGKQWVLTKNMSAEPNAPPYRITFFDGKEPTGHIEVRDFEEAAREMYGVRKKEPETVEPGAEGKPQTILPGAERITDAELAQRRANEPLKPTAEQKPADEGLFGNTDKQTELFQRKTQTDLPEFKRWFGRSKMVDTEGEPQVFFHGSGLNFEQFETRGEHFMGAYFTHRNTLADLYAESGGRKGGSAQVYPVYLKIENPKIIDRPNLWEQLKEQYLGIEASKSTAAISENEANTLRRQGYDGIVNKVHNEVIVFDPKQIKSAIGNRGAFDPNSPKILEQQTRGGIVLNPNAVPGHDYIGMENVKPLLRITSEGNASTFIHESGHQYLAELVRDAAHEAAPQDLKDDLKTVTDWLGLKGPEDLKLYPESNRISKISATKAHEKFARGFEQYLREGVAPSQELAGVFAKFKNWLLGIYRTIKGLGSPINDDVKRVFDRLLTTEPQKTVIAPERTTRPTLADIHTVDARETPPVEAEPRGDLVNSEADRYIAEHQPEIAHEAQTEAAKIQAERSAAGEAPDAATEARPGEPGPAALGASGGQSESFPGGGGVGEGRGAVEAGGGGPVHEGNELPGGERGPVSGERPKSDEGARDQPLAPTPTTTFGAKESTFLDRAGNIRRDHVNVPDDMWAAIKARSAANEDFIGDRRGVITPGQILDLAHKIGRDGAEDLVAKWAKGNALNAEQITILGELVEQQAIDVGALSRAAKEQPTEENILKHVTERARLDMFLRTFMGATAEAGRALYAIRMMNRKAGSFDQALREATGKTLFQTKRDIAAMATMDDPAKVSKTIQDQMKGTWGRYILEYLVNDWLSGIPSHLTYWISNNVLTAERLLVVTPTAAMVGRILGHKGETVTLGEVRAGLEGARKGLAPAVLGTGQALRTGVNVSLPGEEARPVLPFQTGTQLAEQPMANMEATWKEVKGSLYSTIAGMKGGIKSWASLLATGVEGAPTFGARRSQLGYIPDFEFRGVGVAPVGTLVRAPGRNVAAIHTSTRILNYSIDIQQQAYRTATTEGLEGPARDARIADLVQNPTEPMMEHAQNVSNETALMGQAGSLISKISQVTNWETDLPILGLTQPLKFIDPFVTVAGNIFKQSITAQTPLGMLSSEIRADVLGRNGNVAQEMAIAKMVVGSTIGLSFGFLAAQGYMNGSGPTDKNKFLQWRYQLGNLPHSVRVGDMWYDVHRLGSLGMLASTAADMWEVSHAMSQADGQTAAAMFMHAITQNFLDEGFMRGPADLIRAIEDSGRYGDAYVRNFLSGFVPYSVGMAQFARNVDPYSRQTRSFMDAVKAKIPYLSETLLPRRDIWGEPLVNLEGLGYGATVAYESRVNHDPVNMAMFNLGVSPALPERKIRNVQLTDDQYDDFQRYAGRMTKMRLDAIVRSPDWQTWPNHIKHDVISEVIRQSREAAVGTMMMKYPQIVSDATAAKMKKQQD